ncbi:hypothetical protein FHX37_1365 [Haloactinospora alba]|uniref:Uncharacterized protein n=1 Tax=Haloactinospora alba TaxID=405555 RepID=A0A543NI10_9ACTN|nr:hypothetical protein [Haloactinospora alba]TQN31461.1 hypothetical protein FHX37_1365 [Haloactinospora alba]
MSPSESSVSGTPGRRRKPDEADSIAGLAAPAPRKKGSRRRRKNNASNGKLLRVLLSVLGVAVVALVAVLLVQFVWGGATAPEQARPAAYNVEDSQTITEALATREDDNRDIGESEFFERGNEEFESQGLTFELEESDITADCAEAVWGEELRTALREGGCEQAARAGYTSDDHVAAAVVFNLEDTDASESVAEAMRPPQDAEAEAPGFFTVPGDSSPLDRLGGGYSAAEAMVSGHYLVVVWVQSVASDSPQEEEDLTSPLIAVSGFSDPLYRRVVQQENAQQLDGEQPETQ